MNNNYRFSLFGFRFSGNHFKIFPPTTIREPITEKGFVLIFTLIMIAVLSALTIGLSSKMNQEISLLENSSDYLKASALAKGGVQYALAVLEMDEDFEVDGLGEDWAEETVLTFGDETVKINITDESGKINLNYLDTKSEREKTLRIEQMLELCDNISLDYVVVPAIIDWTDSDVEVSEILSITVGENKGAESDYYEDLPFAYPCKNASFDTAEEIMMVKGVDKDNYYGENGLENFVTVFSGGKININTASENVLKATLRASVSASEEEQPGNLELMDDIAVASIMQWRVDNMFSEIPQLSEFFSEEVVKVISSSGLFDVKSNFFMVTSSAQVGKIEKNIIAILKRNQSDIKIKYWNEN